MNRPPSRTMQRPLTRRRLLAGAAGLTLAGLAAMAPAARAQAGWPARSIRLVIPFAPGGVTDTSGRLIADALGKRLGQQVVPDNRPGASGNIGSQIVAQAEPDAYTLLLVLDNTFVINPHVYDKMPFDPVRDFATIGKIGDSTTILVAHPGFKGNNLRELIELSKSQPGGLSYGTSGTGSIVHIAGELLKQRTGANLVHVPYKGGAPAIADALAGHTPLAFASAASVQQHLKAGALKAIGVPSGKRSRQYPDIPTFAESGVANFDINSWVGLVAPARSPKPILDRLNGELNAVLNEPEVRDKLAVSGIVATPGTAEAFAAIIRNELALYGGVVKTAGIKGG
jgi:tripartite-type tricarboxylate transporter receptor subunit TctC